MALTDFTDVGNHLIARRMLVVNAPRRQTVMDSERIALPPQNLA